MAKKNHKRCTQCRNEKHKKHFIKMTGGEYRSCKDCRQEKLEIYYIKSRKDPEGYREYHREYKRRYRAAIALKTKLKKQV